MNTIIQTIQLEKNKLLGILLIGLISVVAGIAISILLRISYQYLALGELALFTVVIAALAKKLKRVLWAFLLITIPVNIDKSLFLNGHHVGGVPGLVVSAWSLLLLCLYVLWFFERLAGKKQRIDFFPRVTIPLALLAVISILSMVKSVALQLSVFQVIQILKVFLLLFYIANNIDTEQDYKFVLYVLFATLFFEICLGYSQYFSTDYIDLGILSDATLQRPLELGYKTITSVSGTLTGDARFADYLSLVLSVLLAALLSKGKAFTKLFYSALFISGLPLLIFTFSRGAWLGFGIGLSLFFALKMILSIRKLSNYFKIIMLALIALIIIFSFKDIISYRIYGEDYGSARSRLPMMTIGYEMIKANPLLGVGINNYTTVMNNYDPIGLTYVYHQPVHNVFIQLAAEIGLPGLFAFLWFIAMLYIYAFKNIIKTNEFFRNQLIGLIAGITALLIHGIVNNATIATDPFILFWVFGGLMLSIAKINQRNLT